MSEREHANKKMQHGKIQMVVAEIHGYNDNGNEL